MKLIQKLALASLVAVATGAMAVNAAEPTTAAVTGARTQTTDEATTGPGVKPSPSPTPTVRVDRPEISRVDVETRNSKTYLTFKVEAQGEIKNVKVTDKNGKNVSGLKCLTSTNDGFYDYEREYEIPITKSGAYKITVTDEQGQSDEYDKDVQVENEGPKLTLSTKTKNGKTYIVIKCEKHDALKKLTVQGSSEKKATSISLTSAQKKGDTTTTIEYEVKTGDTYTVEAIDESDLKDSQDISIGVKPEVELRELVKDNKRYIEITVKGNNDIKEVLVANNKLSGVTAKNATYEYEVTANGSYEVVVRNNANEETKKTISINSFPVQTMQTVKFQLNNKNWTINGAAQPTMDAAPVVRNGRTYLPIRYTSYALGIDSSNISWDNATKTATINNNGNVIKIKINSTALNVNGATTVMDGAAFEMGGRVYIPISQVSKAFEGVSMNWDNTLKEVTIQYMG